MLFLEEIAALKKDAIVADIKKKMLASVVEDQSHAAEVKRSRRSSGHVKNRLRGYRTSGHRASGHAQQKARRQSKNIVPLAAPLKVLEESKESSGNTGEAPQRELDVSELAADAAKVFAAA